MAGRGIVRPVWLKQAEEARLKEEEQKTATAKAAFEATFKSQNSASDVKSDNNIGKEEEEEEAAAAEKPIGPVDPAKCTAAGAGVGGGAAGTVASFVVITRDSDGRRVTHGGESMKVIIRAAAGGAEQEALIKDHGDGSYTVTYAVGKRGDYTVTVHCNGHPIAGSPFPVFFSGGGSMPSLPGTGPGPGVTGVSGQVQTFPNMAMPGMFNRAMSGNIFGANGGLVLPGLGEVCREFLSGRCGKNDCKLTHPQHNQLMVALSAGSAMGTLSQMPMGPSAAAMAAAQTIVAAQALQAHVQSAAGDSAGLKSHGDCSSSLKETDKHDVLSRTVQVSNLSPLLTSEQLRQLFSYCGSLIDFRLVESKQLLYVEYAKPEEAKAALSLNNMDVGGRLLTVEMSKSLPPKMESSSTAQAPPLPMMMQQAVAMQQLQFQQALMMQHAMASQQSANRVATLKSAAEAAAVRAAEISKTLKGDGDSKEEKEPCQTRKSRSKSRSPVRYQRNHRGRSRSLSPIRYRRDHRQRSRSRDRHHHRSHSRDRNNHYRDNRDAYRGYHAIWERGRERDRYSRSLRENRSRSRGWSRSRTRRSSRAYSRSPRYRKEMHTSLDVKRKDWRSARHRKHSKSISKDSREGSFESDLQISPAERRHASKGGYHVKKDTCDVKEDKDKRKTSHEVKGEDHKSGRHFRLSDSISKNSREGSLQKELSTSLVEGRGPYEETKRENHKSARQLKHSNCILQDSTGENVENDLGISATEKKNTSRRGINEDSHSGNLKLISKDSREGSVEKDLTISSADRIEKYQGDKREDTGSASYLRHSKCTSKESRQISLEDLSISPADRRNTSQEVKKNYCKSASHSMRSESKSKGSREFSLGKDLSISPAGSRGTFPGVKGEDHNSAHYLRCSESKSQKSGESSLEKDLSISSEEWRDPLPEVKQEQCKSVPHSRCSQFNSEISTEDSLEKDMSISSAGGRDTLTEVKDDDHHSRCSEFKSNDLSLSPAKSREKRRDTAENRDTIRFDDRDFKKNEIKRAVVISENSIKNPEQSESEDAMDKHNDHEIVVREIYEDRCHDVVAQCENLKGNLKDMMIGDSIYEGRSVSKCSESCQETQGMETNEQIDDVREECRETNGGREGYKEKKRHRSEVSAGNEAMLREITWQVKGTEVVDEVDELGGHTLHKKENKLDYDEEGMKKKKRHKREKESDDKKKRKRHRSRHRKEDDSEKSEKRRKKHKRHQSVSFSTESSPFEDSDKKKKKRKRQRPASYSPQSSPSVPSVDIDKNDIYGKKGSSQHKRKSRGCTNSVSHSHSLQD